MIKTILLRALLLLLLVSLYNSPLFAESVYRSVNEKGDVTYSSKPMDGAKEVAPIQLQPPPKRADVDAAKQRASGLKQAIKASEQREKMRLLRQKKDEHVMSSALVEAEKRVQEAKIVLDSDWQFLAKGGRHLKESYFERIKKAEAEYEAVKKALK